MEAFLTGPAAAKEIEATATATTTTTTPATNGGGGGAPPLNSGQPVRLVAIERRILSYTVSTGA